MTVIVETPRLLLRKWRPQDADAYFEINQDPRVIEFLRGPLTRQQVTDFLLAANQHHDRHGFTLWAVELKTSGALLGFIGLNAVTWQAPFTPAIEIGWRLGSAYWGQGYATEGAAAALQFGFEQCGLAEIIAFTVPANLRSLRVMEKIGLQYDPEGDFAHPLLAPDHPLSKHLLYRLSATAYVACHNQR